MNFRRAQASDAPKLAQVHVDSWQAAYKGLVPDTFLRGFTYQKRQEAFGRALEAGTEETYIVEEDDRALGILTIGASRDDDLDPQTCGEIGASISRPRRGEVEWAEDWYRKPNACCRVGDLKK